MALIIIIHNNNLSSNKLDTEGLNSDLSLSWQATQNVQSDYDYGSLAAEV